MSVSNVNTCSHFPMYGPVYIHMEVLSPKLTGPCADIDEVCNNSKEYAMFLYNKVLEQRRKLNSQAATEISGPRFANKYSNVGQLLKEEKRSFCISLIIPSPTLPRRIASACLTLPTTAPTPTLRSFALAHS